MSRSTSKISGNGLSFRKKLSLKVRRGRVGKPSIEQVHGDDLHQDTGKWKILDRVIDREKNLYHEVVTDKDTGEVEHECKEPLSEHKGHVGGKGKQKRNAQG